jgi:hypothetical protein
VEGGDVAFGPAAAVLAAAFVAYPVGIWWAVRWASGPYRGGKRRRYSRRIGPADRGVVRGVSLRVDGSWFAAFAGHRRCDV